MEPRTAMAEFLRSRATEEILALSPTSVPAPGPGDGPGGSDHALRRRLLSHAQTRKTVADHYLRLAWSSTSRTTAQRDHELERIRELTRTVCLLAGVDRDHPDYPAAAAACPVDCRAPLW